MLSTNWQAKLGRYIDYGKRSLQYALCRRLVDGGIASSISVTERGLALALRRA
jgi:hypothetical protein